MDTMRADFSEGFYYFHNTEIYTDELENRSNFIMKCVDPQRVLIYWINNNSCQIVRDLAGHKNLSLEEVVKKTKLSMFYGDQILPINNITRILYESYFKIDDK